MSFSGSAWMSSKSSRDSPIGAHDVPSEIKVMILITIHRLSPHFLVVFYNSKVLPMFLIFCIFLAPNHFLGYAKSNYRFMTKKSLLFILGGALIVLFIAGAFIFLPHQAQPEGGDLTDTTSKTKEDPKTIDEFIPGETTLSQVTLALGKPLHVGTKNHYTLLYYRLSDLKRESKVYIQNNIVAYTIEEVSNYTYAAYLKKHPKVEGAIYNLYENEVNYNLYTFPSLGMAFLAHDPTHYTIEIHRFAPTTKANYFSTYAPSLTYK